MAEPAPQPKPEEKKPEQKKTESFDKKVDKSLGKLKKKGITPLFVLTLLFGIVFFIAVYTNPAVLGYTIRGVVYLMPLWLPIGLASMLPGLWMTYRNALFISKQKYVLLEVKLPQDIRKSMFGMEAVFAGFYTKSGESTFIATLIKGSVRPWWSLEIVSLEGKIHFYIWTRAFFRNLIESAIYAHFPEVEIVEAEDYSRLVHFDPEKNSVWGLEYDKAIMDTYVPIRTYHDFNLYDPDPDKPEKHVDPLFAVIENMGALGKGEQMWLQIIFQYTKQDWREKAIAEIQRLQDEAAPKRLTGSPFYNERIQSILRNSERIGFDVGMRGIYVADRDRFAPNRLQVLLTVIPRQFYSNKLNSLSPARGLTGFDYPWEDFRNIRQNKVRHHLLDAYRRRSYFHRPHKEEHPVVMSSEELATLWHFPTRGVQTPTLERLPSKRANPPANIPT